MWLKVLPPILKRNFLVWELFSVPSTSTGSPSLAADYLSANGSTRKPRNIPKDGRGSDTGLGGKVRGFSILKTESEIRYQQQNMQIE